MAEEKKEDASGCGFIVLIALGFLGWGGWSCSKSNHLLTPIGLTLPVMKVSPQVYLYDHFVPSDIRFDKCTGNGWTDKLTCDVSSETIYIPGLSFSAFEYSGGKAVKIQDGRADMPSIEEKQTGRMTLQLKDINDVDSIYLWVTSK